MSVMSQLNSYIHNDDTAPMIIFHTSKEDCIFIISVIQGKLIIEVVLALKCGEIHQQYIDNMDMFTMVCNTHDIRWERCECAMIIRKIPVT